MVSIENQNRQRDFAASCRCILRFDPSSRSRRERIVGLSVRHSSDTLRPLEARGVVDRRKEAKSCDWTNTWYCYEPSHLSIIAANRSMRSRSAICRPTVSRALSSGSTAAATAGRASASSAARTEQFGKSGFSVLHESRNGRDFDEVERGRKVDGRLREILRWGIPEPGGTGGTKGLPTSFLATALLSPQEDVGAVLRNSLQDDSTASGKEQIAAALQAVAQDPLFVALLKETQARRDAAYTDKGAKKTAKGSVFKAAAERLNETRDEKERLQRIVADSEGAEKQLRDLTDRRTQKQGALAAAAELAENLEQLAAQAAGRSVAAEQVRLAQEDLLRIQSIGTETETVGARNRGAGQEDHRGRAGAECSEAPTNGGGRRTQSCGRGRPRRRV